MDNWDETKIAADIGGGSLERKANYIPDNGEYPIGSAFCLELGFSLLFVAVAFSVAFD